MIKKLLFVLLFILMSGTLMAREDISSYGLEKDNIRAYDWWANFMLEGSDGNKYMVFILIRPELNSLYSISRCPEKNSETKENENIIRRRFYWKELEYTESGKSVVFKHDDFNLVIKPESIVFNIDTKNLSLRLKNSSLGDRYVINEGKHQEIIEGCPEISGFYKFYNTQGSLNIGSDKISLRGKSCFEHLFTSEYFWHGMRLDWVPFFGDEAYGLVIRIEDHSEGFIRMLSDSKTYKLSNIRLDYEAIYNGLPDKMTVSAETGNGRVKLNCTALGMNRNEILLSIEGIYQYSNGREVVMNNMLGWNETYRVKNKESRE